MCVQSPPDAAEAASRIIAGNTEGEKVKTCIVGVFAAASLFAMPAVVAADPVTITAGHWVEVANIDGGGMTLISSVFNVTGPWGCGANAAGWCGSISAPTYAAGSTVDFTTQANAMGTGGAGSVNGSAFAGGFDSTQLLFSVAPFTLPGATPVGSTISFSIPFTMFGLLTLNQGGTTTVFSNNVTGSGMLAFTLRSVQAGASTAYGLDPLSTAFTFSSTAAATPEPATMLLFATGLVAVGARRFRRRA